MNARPSHRTMTALIFLAFMLLLPVAASATNTGETMPWDQGLTVIMNALSGTTVKIIGVILIIGAGLMIAFTEGAAIKKVGFIVVGLGIALNAASFLTMMFGNASGFELATVKTIVRPAASAMHHLLSGGI
jgi:type IV secretion system protein TrbC